MFKKSYYPMLFVAFVLGCSDGGEDPPPTGGGNMPTLSVSDIQVAEGNTAIFTVNLSETATGMVRFSHSTQNGTAGSADFTASSGNDSIMTGMSSTTISIATTQDTDVESSETFSLILSSLNFAFTGNDSVAVCTIIDDDQPVSTVSYATDVKPMLDSVGCGAIGCHGNGAGSGLTFTATHSSITSAMTTLGDKIIVPFSASTSPVYIMVSPTFYGLSRMPKFQDSLSTAQQNLIRDWINEGALDN